MITEELKQAVIAEATLLKQHATKKELTRLNFKTLSVNSLTSCIYGQMTGSVMNARALRLRFLSANKLISVSLTPIEDYTCFKEANNAALIAFLKDETQTLTL